MSKHDEHDDAALGVDADDQRRAARRAQRPENDQARDFAVAAARLAISLHCEDLVIFDVRGLSDMTDFVVIGSGTSDRQIKAVGSEISALAREHGMERFGTDRDEASTWVVLDFIDVIVHLFEPTTRAHYDLEMMWDDAPRVSLRTA